jgi:hypothetical protein
MQMRAPGIISQTPDCFSGTIARQWLVKFGEICQKEVSSALFAIWDEQLRDIAPDLLDRACDKLAKTWQSGFLPTPGNVRAQIAQADAKGLHVEAEEGWHRALRCSKEYFGSSRVPDLDPVTDRAARAAGGLSFIESCSSEELVWAKKRFLENYVRLREAGESENLMTNGEARKFIRELATLMEANKAKKQLTAGQNPSRLSP